MKNSLTKRMAVCYLIIPMLLTSIYLSISIQSMKIPADEIFRTVLMCVFIPGGVYTAFLLARELTKSVTKSVKICYYALFFVSFPLTLLCGVLLYLPLYCWNAVLLIRGAYPSASKGGYSSILVWCSMMLVLTAILVPAKMLFDSVRMSITQPSPEKAFDGYYPGGTIIGVESEGNSRYILGKDRDGMLVCCQIVPEANGWKIREVMHSSQLGSAHYDTFEVNVFRGAHSDKEMIVLEKFIFFNDDLEKLGEYTFDTVQSVFSESEEKNAVGTNYFYWALVECDQDGYKVTGW